MLLSALGKCKVCFFLSAELLCADLKNKTTTTTKQEILFGPQKILCRGLVIGAGCMKSRN